MEKRNNMIGIANGKAVVMSKISEIEFIVSTRNHFISPEFRHFMMSQAKRNIMTQILNRNFSNNELQDLMFYYNTTDECYQVMYKDALIGSLRLNINDNNADFRFTPVASLNNGKSLVFEING